MAFVLCETVGLTAAIWPQAWLGLFGHDPRMLATGVVYLHFAGPSYGFFGLGLALYFASQGAGRLAWPLFAGFLRMAIAVGGGIAGGEVAFSSVCASAAGDVNSSLKASRDQVESISLPSSSRFLASSAGGLVAVAHFSRPAGDVNSSSKATRAHAVAIWRKAKRAAPSRLSTAHWPQSFDNLQHSSANDVAPSLSAIKSITGAKRGQ